MRMFIFMFLVATLLASVASGQDLTSGREMAGPKDLPLASRLRDAQNLAGTIDGNDALLRSRLQDLGLRLDDRRRVHVTIHGPEGADAIAVSAITAVGGEDDIAWRRWRDAWVPVDRLVELSRNLPPGYFLAPVQAPETCDVAGEGPAAIHSDDYRDGGADGWGRTIAIIDAGFDGLTEAWNNGDIPSPYHWHNYTPDPLESQTVHGTGCVEAAFDHCPDATFHLYMLDSVTDLGPAVENAHAVGVNVISMSLVWCANGYWDNEGEAADAVNWSANSGLVTVVAAGNYAQTHYHGGLNVGGDDWHNFGPDDETINIIVPSGGQAQVSMTWDRSGDTHDLDLYLFDSGMNEIASSTNPDDYFEQITWTNSTGSDQLVHVAVLLFSGGGTTFEIYVPNTTWQEHIVSASSCPPPNNATAANVISVGAVNWDDYDNPNGTSNIITSYSSRGPSNNGMILPDLCGPTNCTGFTYSGGMGGTSNATPNVAGALTCLWSADAVLYTNTERWLAYRMASLWRDWGPNGMENTYGRGGLTLWDYHPNTLWIARSAGNTNDHRSYPLYTVQAANDFAVHGGRLVFLDADHYPEPATVNKALQIDTPAGTVVLGE